MEAMVKITPRVAAQVARRLRLAASVGSRSMSAMVNDALDETLPSLEEIRMQLAAPDEPGPGMPAGPAVPVMVPAAGARPEAAAPGKGAGDGGIG